MICNSTPRNVQISVAAYYRWSQSASRTKRLRRSCHHNAAGRRLRPRPAPRRAKADFSPRGAVSMWDGRPRCTQLARQRPAQARPPASLLEKLPLLCLSTRRRPRVCHAFRGRRAARTLRPSRGTRPPSIRGNTLKTRKAAPFSIHISTLRRALAAKPSALERLGWKLGSVTEAELLKCEVVVVAIFSNGHLRHRACGSFSQDEG